MSMDSDLRERLGQAICPHLPQHTGDYLAERRHDLGYKSLSELGRALGVSRQYIHALLTGKDPVGPDVLEMWNAIDPEYDIVTIRVVVPKRKPKKRGK